MLKVGGKLTAKQEFVLKYSIPFENREYVIKEIDSYCDNGFIGTIESKGSKFSGHINTDLFYVTETLNDLIQDLINKEEIKSFNAVTVDGKVINVELT
ncbi:hypothetical protein ABEY43_07325 [Priestia megaterium]